MEMVDVPRQYGGYGGLYGGYGGGYVECCDGVVDPILLLGVIVGLAALTWWLRLQVVTFIAGRSLHINYLEEITNNILGQDKYHDVKSEGLSCYAEVGGCLAQSALLGLEAEDEAAVVGEAGLGLVEYLVTGDIKTSWTHLGHRRHVSLLPACLLSLRRC